MISASALTDAAVASDQIPVYPPGIWVSVVPESRFWWIRSVKKSKNSFSLFAQKSVDFVTEKKHRIDFDSIPLVIFLTVVSELTN